MSVKQLVPLDSKSYSELQKIAKELGIRASGKKADLIKRIKEKRLASNSHDTEDNYLSQVDVNDPKSVRRIYKKLAVKCNKKLTILNSLERENIDTKAASRRVKKLILDKLKRMNDTENAQNVRKNYKIVNDARGYKPRLIEQLERWSDMSYWSVNKFPYEPEQVLTTISELENVLRYFSHEINRLKIKNAEAFQLYEKLNANLTELEQVADAEGEGSCTIS